MADSPQGWQFPQPPMYPQGPAGPGSLAQPARPAAMRRAVSLMYAGAALAVVNGIVDGLTTKNVTFYTSTSTSSSSSTATVHSASSLTAGIITGVICAALWLWMAWKAGAGRNWARVLSTLFFGFACLQLIGGIVAAVGAEHAVLAFITILIEWGVGLAVLILLWQRESSQFIALVRQVKLMNAYSATYPGYPIQPPQYGQPGDGQHDSYG